DGELRMTDQPPPGTPPEPGQPEPGSPAPVPWSPAPPGPPPGAPPPVHPGQGWPPGPAPGPAPPGPAPAGWPSPAPYQAPYQGPYPGPPARPAPVATARPVRIEVLPGTGFGVAYPSVSPTVSGLAIGSMVAGIGSIIVSFSVFCFGLTGARDGWGLLV